MELLYSKRHVNRELTHVEGKRLCSPSTHTCIYRVFGNTSWEVVVSHNQTLIFLQPNVSHQQQQEVGKVKIKLTSKHLRSGFVPNGLWNYVSVFRAFGVWYLEGGSQSCTFLSLLGNSLKHET